MTATTEELLAIHDRIRACTACPLHATRTNAVPGYGPVTARIMAVGEAPGAAEDKEGKPFVGAAGKLLTRLLEEVGLDRRDIYITNTLKCRPPQNRDPQADEVRACSHFLDDQIELLRPDVILILGRHALGRLLPGAGSISSVHGEKVVRGDRLYVPLYHPAAALYDGSLLSTLQADMRRVKEPLAARPRTPPKQHQRSRWPSLTETVNGIRLVPLGGLGEIGRNMMAIQSGDDIIVVDAGLMFPEQDMLGVDLVIPDITWLLERAAQVRGIVLTHGHEDHIGALPYILPRLPVPVYGTSLSLGFLRHKLKEHALLKETSLHPVRPGEVRRLGHIEVEWIHTTHSVPDSCALAIHTPMGLIVHSGDFKLDETPVQGMPPDLKRFAQLGESGVLLLLSDSTNVEHEGRTPSESSVGPTLESVVGSAPGRVLLATFASNISRLQQAINAAQNHDRRCFLVGRSLLKNSKVAQELGFLQTQPGLFVNPKQQASIPDAQLLLLCTGAQGEPLSALSRIAAGEHPMVGLHPGDTVILSANPIPGNEEAVHRTVNNLYRQGARVLRGPKHHVHASGHASGEELRTMIQLLKPRYFMPVHGEYRHLALHGELARNTGLDASHVMVADNGTVVQIDEGGIHRLPERVPAGYVYVDGLSIEEDGDVVLRDRRHLAQDGVVIVVLTVERSSGQVVTGPDLISRGFSEDPQTEQRLEAAKQQLIKALNRLRPDPDPLLWQQELHDELSRHLYKETRRRPMILPVITEI